MSKTSWSQRASTSPKPDLLPDGTTVNFSHFWARHMPVHPIGYGGDGMVRAVLPGIHPRTIPYRAFDAGYCRLTK